jgi:transcription elongation GreA/GreB family factor
MLIKKRVGDEVEVKAPIGSVYYEVIAVRYEPVKAE